MLRCITAAPKSNRRRVPSCPTHGLSLHPDKPRGEIVGARPHTFGWLRRSEFDALADGWYFEAWERPDGGIVKLPRPDGEPVTTIIAVHGCGSPAVVVWPKGTVQI